MEWFRVDVAFILSAEFLALPEAPRAHWLSLAAYCAQQHNGGVIRGAVKWRDREWRYAAGMLRRSADAMVARGLLMVGGEAADKRLAGGQLAADERLMSGPEDYVLTRYDFSGEQRVQGRNETNRKNAESRWSKHATAGATAGAALPVRNAHTDETDETRRTDIRKKTRALPEVSAAAREVATYLLEAIRSHKADAADGAEGWAKDIDLAIRIDRRTPEQLRAVIDFAHRGRDLFWRPNLLSGAKLRKHFDAIAIKAMSNVRDIRTGHVAVTGNEKYAGGEVKL